jgi:hypothetical protein
MKSPLTWSSGVRRRSRAGDRRVVCGRPHLSYFRVCT